MEYIAHGEDDQCVEGDAQNDGEDEDLADFLQRHVDLFGGLRDDIESDEEERADGGHFDDGAHHALHAAAGEHLPVKIRGVAGDNGCHDKQDARGADGEGQNVLQLGRGLRTHDIDHGDEYREDDGRGQPGGVDVESCDGVQVALQELRPHIGDDGRQRACLETHDADIAQDDGPCADE